MGLSFASIIISLAMIASAGANAASSYCSTLLTKDMTAAEVAFVLAAIQSPNPERLLLPSIITEIEKVADLSPGSIIKKEYDANAVVDAVIEIAGDTRAHRGVGEQLQALMAISEKTLQKTLWTPTGAKTDAQDLLRGYGYMLLPRSDPAFFDPDYLHRHLRVSGQTGVSEWGVDEPNYASQVFFDEMRGRQGSDFPEEVFVLTDGPFFQSGSDANNALYEIANHAASARLEKPVNDAEILFFEGSYSAGRGRMKERNFFRGDQSQNPYYIPAPYTPHWNPLDSRELAQLSSKEEESLRIIRKKVSTSDKPIGGIILEPIVGSYGVLFFRTEYLLKLRALCDELKILIFADEILTGGGRTGRWFAYQHYEGFKPDFLTYGKGLQIAGIATVYRKKPVRLLHLDVMVGRYNTLQGTIESIVKAGTVLKRIREGGLVKNAAKMGEYFLSELHKAGFANARGKGLLINPGGRSGLQETEGLWRLRYMPYLTITKPEIDQIIQRLKESPEKLH